jgi:hypothetical protein
MKSPVRALPVMGALVVPSACTSPVSHADAVRELEGKFGEHAARILAGSPWLAEGDGWSSSYDPVRTIDASVPSQAEGAIAFALQGMHVEVHQLSCAGRRELHGSAIVTVCRDASSFLHVSAAGYEDWLLSPWEAVAHEPVVRWRVDGAILRQHGRSIDLYDAEGNARISVSAPLAYDCTGRPLGARLVVSDLDGFFVALDEDACGPVLIDPAWVPAGAMAQSRAVHTLTRLLDGRVLVAGGAQSVSIVLSTAELWDPSTTTWSSAAPMAEPRYEHTATLMPGGSVLVAAGSDASFDLLNVNAELYDAVTDTWSSAGTCMASHADGAAVLLPDGSVVVAGGDLDPLAPVVDRYDPTTNSWSAVTPPPPGYILSISGIMLDNGLALFTGVGSAGAPGPTPAGLYDYVNNSWSLTPLMTSIRSDAAIAALPNGHVLVVGGGDPLGSAEVYDLATNTWTAVAPMAVPRHLHTAATLPDGRVIVVGGRQGDFMYTATTEIYDEASDSWAPGPTMSIDRTAHDMVNLGGGQLLVAGGTSNTIPLATTELLKDGRANGTPCARGSDCATGFCVDGVCCNTACDAGTCDACSVALGALADGVCYGLTGTACDDGDSCTQTDACAAGSCQGSDAVMCARSDECHEAGSCNPATGACSNPPKADGAPCSLGVCLDGVCAPEGSGGAGGEGATGGMSTGAAGAPGATGAPSEDAGCSCRTARERARGPIAALSLLFVALGLARRSVRALERRPRARGRR